MKFLELFTIGITPVLAWNAEYAGFVHFRDWNLDVNVLQGGVKLPDGAQLPSGLSKDYCALDSACNAFGGFAADGRYFRQMISNSSTDVYLANDSSVLAGKAICSIEPAGCGSNQKWLACANDFVGGNNIIGTFALPPDVIHSSCLSNPDCIGFRVTNTGASGTLLKDGGGNAPGWFALPNGDKQNIRV